MSIVVPAAGFSVFRQVAAADTYYEVLGPVGPGLWIVDLQVWVHVAGANNLNLAAVVGGSSEASAVGLGAGQSLIARSATHIAGKPTVRLYAAGEVATRLRIPVGMRVRAGAKWVVVGFTASAVTAMDVLLSVRTVEVLGEGAEKVED